MLLLNGKEFNLDSEEGRPYLEEFLAAVPKFDENTPLNVIYHPSRVKWNELNQKYDKPEKMGFPFRSVVNRPGKGNQTWIYCEHYEAHQATGAILNRTPWNFQLKGRLAIPYHKKDLAFYLWLTEYCANGENPNPNRKDFMFEDRETDARLRLERERLEAQVKSLILNDESSNGLSDDKIKEIGIAYRMPDGLGMYETRYKLFSQVSREKDGLKKFINMLENPQEKERIVLLRKAEAMGVIRVSGIKIEKGGLNQGWRLFDRDGKTVKIFGKHQKSKRGVVDAFKYLEEAIQEDPTIMSDIMTAVETYEMQAVED